MIIFGIALGGLGYYTFAQQQAQTEPEVVSIFAMVEPPKFTSILQVSENRSANSILVVKRGLGISNNAVLLQQWLYKSRVGVDFTEFDWNSLNGIGAEYGPEPVLITGVLPPLLPMGAGEVTSEKDTTISKILGFNEKRLLDVAKSHMPSVNDCTRDVLLYDAEVIDHAKTAVEQLFSVSAPRDAQGALRVRFDLTFANEEALREEIAKRAKEAIICGGLVEMDAK